MRASIALLVAVLGLGLAGNAGAANYFVSPDGSDANPGSRALPWQTTARVNNQQLRPGDTVSFAGGATFEGPLVPWGSGSKKAPVAFTSYGTGRATISSADNNVLWIPGNKYLVFDNLRLTSANGDNHVIVSNPRGTSANIVIRNCLIFDSGAFGINSPSFGDRAWTIEGNTISRTHETGITFRGADFVVRNNVIVNTGTDPSEAAHGVYAKGPRAQVLDNTIVGFGSSGISIRYQGSVARGNRIADGPIGISYFQESDAKKGKSIVAYNKIDDVTLAGIFFDDSTVEEFIVANNSIRVTNGNGVNIHRVRGLVFVNNVVTGTFDGPLLLMRAPSGRYVEHHNAYFPGSGDTFAWNGVAKTFDEYKSASGQGGSDLLVDPQLDSSLRPKSDSPVIEAGARLGGLHRAGCDGTPFRFCGTAPEIGAVEAPRRRKKRRPRPRTR